MKSGVSKKKITYILLFVVVGVWGLIVYRAFFAISASPSSSLFVETKRQATSKLENHLDDSVTMRMDYPDPFFKIEIEEVKFPKTMLNSEEHSVFKTAGITKVKWPTLSYLGSLANGTGKIKIAIVQIGTREMMMGIGQEYEHVNLLAITRDSIKVKYENETRYVKIR